FHAWQVMAGDDAVHPGKRPGAARVDALDERVRMGTPQQLAVGQAREGQVVGGLGLAGDLGPGVDLRQRLPGDGEARFLYAGLAERAAAGSWRFIRKAASSTASRILV